MNRIKLGICQKSLGLPFRRSLPAAQKIGVAAIELEATGELTPQNLTQTGRREITHLLRSHDLVVSAISCPLRRGLDVAENLEPRLEHIRNTMALAFDLGPRLVIIPVGKIPGFSPLAPVPRGEGPGVRGSAPRAEGDHSDGMPNPLTPGPSPPEYRGRGEDAAFQLLKEALLDLGRHGDRTGVMVALDSGVDSPATLVGFLDRLDVGSLGINFNPANLVLAGHNPHDAVKTLNRRLTHAHAQDARRISPARMASVPLGHGDLDWLQLLADFEEVGYRSFLTVLGADRAELAAGADFLRRFVA